MRFSSEVWFRTFAIIRREESRKAKGRSSKLVYDGESRRKLGYWCHC